MAKFTEQDKNIKSMNKRKFRFKMPGIVAVAIGVVMVGLGIYFKVKEIALLGSLVLAIGIWVMGFAELLRQYILKK